MNKIIIWDNKIYIDEIPSIIQPFTRYITGQSRYNIQLFLHEQFKEYSIILKNRKMLQSITLKNTLNIYYYGNL